MKGSSFRLQKIQLEERIDQAKALVFDFDGTLVDSNPIKWRAFERCFAEFPEHLPEILRYCHGNPHIPRGDKFKYVVERILGRPYTPKMAGELHWRFEANTNRQIIEAPALPGAQELLEALEQQKKVTALLSSTPHEIIWDILRGRSWGSYFMRVRGAPVHKATWLSAFRGEHGGKKQSVLFFGDTQEDADSALEADCAFIAVANPDVHSPEGLFLADFRPLLPLPAIPVKP